MNNLVFNTVASELKTAVYGLAPDMTTQALRVDGSGQLLVTGSLTISDNITVSAILAPVTIGNASLTVDVANASLTVDVANASLTVTGQVEVTNASLTVDVANDSLTVDVANASLTVAGTVTVSEISSPITIGGSAFVEIALIEEPITGTGVLLENTDISSLKVASIYAYNDGDAPITLSLQVSPVADSARYLNDPNYTEVVIESNEGVYMSVSLFAHYVRLQYDMGAESSTITAYFLGQA